MVSQTHRQPLTVLGPTIPLVPYVTFSNHGGAPDGHAGPTGPLTPTVPCDSARGAPPLTHLPTGGWFSPFLISPEGGSQVLSTQKMFLGL